MKIYLHIFIFIFIFIAFYSPGQTPQFAEFKYISPMPGSKYIMPDNNIALRHGDEIQPGCIPNILFDVHGTKSGKIEGKTLLSADKKTIIFLPSKPFELAETIHVGITGFAETTSGLKLNEVKFSFRTVDHQVELPVNYSLDNEIAFGTKTGSLNPPRSKRFSDNELPEDFPELTAEVLNEPAESGYYYVSPFGYWGWFPDNIPYLIIYDPMGTPVYYRRLDFHAYDLKLNVNNMLSYYYNEWPAGYNQIMDLNMDKTDIYTMQNGYSTDFHEFFFLENGHAFVMAYDPQIVDMSQVVQGGFEDAIVTGWVIQELDTDKNVVFQWRSWDHYDILDAEGYVNLTASSIDLIHGNTIEVVSDDHLLLSPRNLNEITKIDRNTGDIIWRLGGNNNMFEFTNDTLGFSMQHDCRILANGNLSLFDNGTLQPEPQFSSMVEYELDEENFTATLVRRLRSDPDIFGTIMGNSQETPNGNIVNGWGSGVPGVTEFNTQGEVAAEYYFAGINYRAYRFPWETEYFQVDTDTLHYGYIWYQEQLTKNVTVSNNQDEAIQLTGYHVHSENFMIETEFPVTIPAGGQTDLEVTFSPAQAGEYSDLLTLNSDINSDTLTQRIAQQMRLIGFATQGQDVGELSGNQFVVSPNPASDKISISFEDQIKSGKIILMDISGRKTGFWTITNDSTFELDVSHLPKGIYLVRITTDRYQKPGMARIIKR